MADIVKSCCLVFAGTYFVFLLVCTLFFILYIIFRRIEWRIHQIRIAKEGDQLAFSLLTLKNMHVVKKNIFHHVKGLMALPV